MASHVLTEKTGAGRNHRERVSGMNARASRLQKKTLPPQVLDAPRFQRENVAAAGAYVQPGYEVGHWVKPDPRDTDMKIRRELINNRDGGGTPFGLMTAGQEVIDYLKEKKDQEAYWDELRLAGYLIDSQKPETQEHAFTVFPELKEVPEQYHIQNLAIQEALRTLLRDGRIAGKDDNSLIYHIIRPDFVLPIFPAWDPEGLIIGDQQLRSQLLELQYENAQAGLFSPRNWGIQHPNRAMQNIQLTIKRMLLRRLYPGLRNAADGTLNTLMQRRSPLVEGENIGNNVPEFFQQIGGLGGGGNANVNPNMNVAE
jgi:hypothetical protein